MIIVSTLNYRGMQDHVTKENKPYFTYYFEDINGISTQFNSSEKYNLEKGKDYKLQFNVSKMFFNGFVK